MYSIPSTRYSGSKLRLLNWIWDNIAHLEFKSVLDAMGGSGSVSLLLKSKGKKVFYNDLLKFNQTIATAIIENDSVIVSNDEIQNILSIKKQNLNQGFIQTEFKNIFFTDTENNWIDGIICNINSIKNKYKKSILLSALFQACLAKRPFNLFHRANLYIRTNNVKRSFGNKTTWETPFPELFIRYINEYNHAVFSNGKKNKVIGGYDVLESPNGVDLVYLDPPYFSMNSSQGTNYLQFYHFLELLVDYEGWKEKTHLLLGKIKCIPEIDGIDNFTKKSKILDTFYSLICRFNKNTIVLSYQSEGIPTKDQIIDMLISCNKKVTVKEIPHQYVLSRKIKSELLFIAQ